MRCPTCGDPADRVIDSREARDGMEIRRRRECLECGRRFTTRERIDEALPKIVKRDGRREDYERSKLVKGLEQACIKRPVPVDAQERVADRIEKRLSEQGDKEIPSHRLGEWVMDELVALDAVAAARFASVFEGFDGPEDYARFFQSLARRARGG
jgi:transcriptional repressor NrdR